MLCGCCRGWREIFVSISLLLLYRMWYFFFHFPAEDPKASKTHDYESSYCLIIMY